MSEMELEDVLFVAENLQRAKEHVELAEARYREVTRRPLQPNRLTLLIRQIQALQGDLANVRFPAAASA